MRRYSIKDYSKPCKYVGRRRMCYYDWYDILLDVTTPNTTSLNSIISDDDNIINRYNMFRNIKNVSNSAKIIMLKIRINCNRKCSLRNLV